MKTTTELEPAALYWASFNRFELRLPGAAVMDIAQYGSNDVAVSSWIDECQFHHATPDAIRAELKECGAWDAEELADDEANRARIVWQAAWQIAEEDAPDCSAPVGGETVTPPPPLSDVGSRYGAPTGRCNTLPDDLTLPITVGLYRLTMIDGDYDEGGAYWGGWSPQEGGMWRAVGDGVEIFVRALTRKEAEDKVCEVLPAANVRP